MKIMFALLVGIALAGAPGRGCDRESARPPASPAAPGSLGPRGQSPRHQGPKSQGLTVEYVGLDGVRARYVGHGQALFLEAMRDQSVIYDAERAVLTDLELPPRRAGNAARQFAIDEAVRRARERLERRPPSDRDALLRLYPEATQALVAELAARGGEDPDLFGLDLHLPILLRAVRATSPPARD
jgi:hypothetical protein